MGRFERGHIEPPKYYKIDESIIDELRDIVDKEFQKIPHIKHLPHEDYCDMFERFKREFIKLLSSYEEGEG